MRRLMAVLTASVAITLQLLAISPAAAFDPLSTSCTGSAASSPVCTENNSNAGNNPITGQNGIVSKISKVVLFAVGAASVIMIIFGGLKIVTSQGDAKGVASGRDTILAALIGVLIAVLAKAIVQFFVERTIK